MNFKIALVWFLLSFGDYGFASQANANSEKKQNISTAEKVPTDLHRQAQELYDRLGPLCVDITDPNVQFYYQKINSIISKPDPGVDNWYFPIVIISGRKIFPQSDGIYRTKEISFTIKSLQTNNIEQGILVSVLNGNGTTSDQFCSKYDETKELCLAGIESYADLQDENFSKRAFWRKKLKFKGFLFDAKNKRYKIFIDGLSEINYPVKIHGIAFVFNKIIGKTKIYGDFSDNNDKVIHYNDPVFISSHAQWNADQKIYRIDKHKLFECQPKDVISFFDSPESLKRWTTLEGQNFYDLKKQKCIPSLPGSYLPANGVSQTLCDPLIWIFGPDEDHDLVYELEGLPVFEDKNDYIYSLGDGSFAPTLQYQQKVYEYCAPKNKTTLQCLEKIAKPTLKFHTSVVIVGGHQHWDKGVYQRNYLQNTTVWQRIEAEQLLGIEQISGQISYQFGVNADNIHVNWPRSKDYLTAEENRKWCAAAQRFFAFFHTRIYRCNKDLLSHFKSWSNLRNLNLSALALDSDKDLTMPVVLQAVGNNMQQLEKFDFSHNCPITDFAENYTQLADRCTRDFLALGACIGKLKKLEELHIQGMWLKYFNTNITKWQWEQKYAILTGIINHQNRQGVATIIDNISQLSVLKKLSIDGIFSQGSSFVERKGLAAWQYIPVLLFVFYSESQQEAGIKDLREKSAQNLAKIKSLQTINLYSPKNITMHSGKGDCFSGLFEEELNKCKPKDCSSYQVISSKLE